MVYRLYLEAGAPSLEEMTDWVATDDDLPGAPERDSIHRIVHDDGMPPSQADVVAVVTVLARAARWDSEDAVRRARDLWVAARLGRPVGTPLGEVADPFTLEVHRPIAVDGAGGLPALPSYVRRAHDERLAAVVAEAAAGASRMVVLVAGSSAGKTRALWQALEPLRAAGGWRLWHPYDPTRPDAALQALDRVEKRTVVWLNETQQYLGAPGDGGEVAAKLRTLLDDPSRAPVLVLGTLWREHHADLTQDSTSQVAKVLDGTVIELPETFTGSDLAALSMAAGTDARLAAALKHADDGHITQYLAGAPELLTRYQTAPAAAKAVMWAAMDARRLGHRNALPLAFLEAAAPAYLTDTQWDQLGEDWLEQALAYTGLSCKGARGPVTRVRPDPNRTSASDTGPVYRLADYLDQHGRRHRADQIPPPGFWAAAAHAHPGDHAVLGNAAQARGLYRAAAQLHKNATSRGDTHAAAALITTLHTLHPTDHRPAHFAAIHAALDNPRDVAKLLKVLQRVGAREQAITLADRAAAHAALDNPHSVADLVKVLWEVGTREQVTTLANRAAVLNDPRCVAYLLHVLHTVGAPREQITALADRAAAHTALDNPHSVAYLLNVLRGVGAREQVSALVARGPAAHAALDNPHSVAALAETLWEVGAREQVSALVARGPAARVALDNPHSVANLLKVLWEVGAREQVSALVARGPAAHAALDNPHSVAALAETLWEVGAREQVSALGDRAALDNPRDVADLLWMLWTVGAREQATALADRAAAHAALDNPHDVADLLRVLWGVGAWEQITALADRAALDDPSDVAALAETLWGVGAREQVSALVERGPAAHAALDAPSGVAYLLKILWGVGAREQVSALVERGPAARVALDNPHSVAYLLKVLWEVGAREQVTMLADRAALDNPRDMAALVERLWEAGAREQATALADRAALDNPQGVANLLYALQRVGARELISALVARGPAAHVALDDPQGVANLLNALHGVGGLEQVAPLADRAAAHAALDNPHSVAELLKVLQRVGAGEQVITLAGRAAALDSPRDAAALVGALWEVGAREQATTLADRLPASGQFNRFLKLAGQDARFRFGRETNGHAADRWAWDDLGVAAIPGNSR
ncbi:hypothetical protein ACQPZP_40705 [Spirillospora sp. CA-142024]|uniref:hypothetical protein n=1 Tax=Spirillospora sp. CA-142024 TaxID=3240036 RepID=UPI003D8EDB1F